MGRGGLAYSRQGRHSSAPGTFAIRSAHTFVGDDSSKVPAPTRNTGRFPYLRRGLAVYSLAVSRQESQGIEQAGL